MRSFIFDVIYERRQKYADYDRDVCIALRGYKNGSPTCVGIDDIPVRAGTVLVLPGAFCSGCSSWSIQPFMAADTDHRTAVRWGISQRAADLTMNFNVMLL